jgi:multiple antibiotic resistance protein
MEFVLAFLHLVFVGFVSLFPPVNPIGTALIVDPLIKKLSTSARRAASIKIALYCFSICTITLLIGTWIFKLFGISLPVVQIAGGILICRMGWQLLSSNQEEKQSKELSSPDSSEQGIEKIQGLLFYPLSFPMTTGAGTISVLLTLGAHGAGNDLTQHLANLGALFTAILLMSILIFLSYAYTPALLRRLGPGGEQVVNRLSAFLVFCVGIQIASGGLLTLFK